MPALILPAACPGMEPSSQVRQTLCLLDQSVQTTQTHLLYTVSQPGSYVIPECFPFLAEIVQENLAHLFSIPFFRDGRSLACVLSPSPPYTRGLHSSDETQNSTWYNTPSQFTSMSHTMRLTCSLSHLYQTFPTAVHCR